MLELTDGARERIRELQDLANKAEDGDEDARKELRVAVQESAPEVIARCSNTARIYRGVLAMTASGGNPLVEEAIKERAAHMAGEIAGESPTPLEALLADRIASLWVLVELQEALNAAWYRRSEASLGNRVHPDYMLKMVKLQESTHRRYLAAIRELARVRKLQANTPGVQFNTQINLSGGSG
jgi:hypothetical protein